MTAVQLFLQRFAALDPGVQMVLRNVWGAGVGEVEHGQLALWITLDVHNSNVFLLLIYGLLVVTMAFMRRNSGVYVSNSGVYVCNLGS